MGSQADDPLPDLPCRLPEPYAHYEVLRRLGSGGQGVVYRAQRVGDPAIRAIKFVKFPKNVAADPELHVQDFLNEAVFGQGCRSLHLGHTLEVLDLRRYPPWPPVALVMDYYPCSLHDVLQRSKQGYRFAPQQVIDWTRDLARALDDLHGEHRRVHRDVKPANIMFRLPPGRRYSGPESVVGAKLLLTDFGTTGPVDGISALTVYHDEWNDPALYPEKRDDSPPEPQRCVPAMDVYSFGKVLLAFAQIVDGPPDWLEEAAAPCLHADPEQRPHAADLIPRLSLDWDEQVRLSEQSGWRPEKHKDFVGRQFVFDAFETFVRSCGNRGGVFVIEGPAGVGKSALLTKWAERTGRPLGYYFRYRHRDAAAAMPRMIAEQLRQHFNLIRPAQESDAELSGLIERLCKDIARSGDTPKRLLLFIDGLDEADEPAQAVGFLPEELPRDMYAVVSTRPPAQGEDHLALLRDAGATIYPLQSDSSDNLKDVERFFHEQLGTRLVNGQSGKLASHTGGIFLLARLLVEAIQGGKLTVDESLRMGRSWMDLSPDKRLTAYYKKSWQRICSKEKKTSARLATLAALLAAAQDWVSESMLGQFLCWHDRKQLRREKVFWQPDRIRSTCDSLTWFLDRREGEQSRGPFYQIRHQSVRDYLLSPDGPVSHASLADMNASLGRYFLQEAGSRRGWYDVGTYGRFFAVRHLYLASDEPGHEKCLKKAKRLLCDYDYLQAMLGEASPGALTP